MDKAKFKEFLSKNEIVDKQIDQYLSELEDYQEFLMKEKLTLETVDPQKLVEYTEQLVSKDSDSVLVFIRAILNYANFSKRLEFISSVIDISEASNAMDTLDSRIAEVYGEEIRNEIFSDLTIPSLGVHTEKKPEFTKVIMKRVEEKFGEKKTIELLEPCLHGRPYDNFEEDRKDYQELGIDGFLKKKYQKRIKAFEKHRDKGTYAFAQPVDDQVVDYVKSVPNASAGIREGNIIYVTKVPYQTKKYLETNDERMKRFYCCYCPWLRGAIKNGTEKEISKNFCQCSAGWFKLYWDKLFEQPVKVEPVETVLSDGVLLCKFAIHLPDDVIIKEE